MTDPADKREAIIKELHGDPPVRGAEEEVAPVATTPEEDRMAELETDLAATEASLKHALRVIAIMGNFIDPSRHKELEVKLDDIPE